MVHRGLQGWVSCHLLSLSGGCGEGLVEPSVLDFDDASEILETFKFSSIPSPGSITGADIQSAYSWEDIGYENPRLCVQLIEYQYDALHQGSDLIF